MSLKIGNEAEDKASSYLQKEGYAILERNFHSKFGEIDIIAKKENILHFCEVKFSQNYDPITRITSSKMNKIINSTFAHKTKLFFGVSTDNSDKVLQFF